MARFGRQVAARIADAIDAAGDGFGHRLAEARRATSSSLRLHGLAGVRRLREVLLYSVFRTADIGIVEGAYSSVSTAAA